MTPKTGDPATKIQCPRCETRLDVIETQSGGRVVAVATLGHSVQDTAIGLETFQPPDAGPQILCPACRHTFDPSGFYRTIPRLNRR